MRQDEVVALFLTNVRSAGATAVHIPDTDSLEQALSEFISEDDLVYCPSMTDLEKSVPIPPEKRTADYASASVTVEEVSAAIAETGSIACTSTAGKILQASVLPPRHVAIVPQKKILADLDEYLRSVGDTPPTNITLITGPSRTADIELTLTIGVHGPGQLDVIVVG